MILQDLAVPRQHADTVVSTLFVDSLISGKSFFAYEAVHVFINDVTKS